MSKSLLFFTLFLTVNFSLYGQKSEEKLVRKTFENYRENILNDKGEEAVNYVDSRTIKYYGYILELVKEADSAKVATLSILDRLMVFSIRHRASREDILSFDGKSLLIYAITSGMVGKNSVANNSIGEVNLEGNFAKGQFLTSGQKTPLFFHFYKEDNQWKIDLTSIFPITNVSFQKIANDSGLGENDYLFYLLEIISGKKPGREIWQPVN